jgi:hypothetical protein
MRNGRASFLAWVVALTAFIVCRALKLEAEEVKYALTAATGVFIANLGISQGQRTAKIEERSIETSRKVNRLEGDVILGQERANRSEARESEWSNHRNHSGEGDDG